MIKRAVSAMIVATLAFAGLIPIPAHAVRTEGFTIKNAIVKDGPEGNVRGRPGTFSFDWSTEELGRRPKAGEGFEITTHYLLMTGKRWEKQPMTVGDTEIGTCLLEVTTIDCTVDDRINQLPENTPVEGHVETPMQAHYMVSSRTLPSGYYAPTIWFTFNSKPVEVAIPNGIARSSDSIKPFSTSQPSGYSSDRPFGWTVDFHPTILAEHNPQAYKKPDGTTKLSYKFTVDSSMQFAEDFQARPWELREIPQAGSPVTPLVNTSNSPANDFEITVTENGNTKEITVQGPFKPEHRYNLYLLTNFQSALKPQESATITTRLESYNGESTLYIKNPQTDLFERGYGIVTVRGLSSTDIPVPYDTHLYGDLTYDLPGDTKASDYPDWKDRPRDIADNDQSGTIKVEYKFGGGSGHRIAVFPEGTKLSFKPREEQWYWYKYDPAQTTVDPAELTVSTTGDNRFVVTYVVTAERHSSEVGVEVTGPKEAVHKAKSTQSTISWVCTLDGQESERGEESILNNATRHSMSTLSLFKGSECTITQQLPQIAGYRLDTDQSVLEQKVTITADMGPILFKNHYVEDAQQPQAETASEETPLTTSAE